MSTEIYLEEQSPAGDVIAVVEQDDRVAYFYLRSETDPDFGLKSCWVRNLISASPDVDRQAMQQGKAPLLPLGFCRFPEGQPALREDQLSVIWFEEGNGAALMCDNEPLAIIPPWSGVGNFSGYARDCVGESPFCWPLPAEPTLYSRLERADEFWNEWVNKNPWPSLQQSLLNAYRLQLGEMSTYFSTDGGCWPPRAILKIPNGEGTAFVTAGMCIRPQPNIELHDDRPELKRRIELGFYCGEPLDELRQRELLAFIAGVMNHPWQRHQWLAEGHTMEFTPALQSIMAPLRHVLLVDQFGSPFSIRLPSYREDPVTLLWMIPITTAELRVVKRDTYQKLLHQLAQIGVTRAFRFRESVV